MLQVSQIALATCSEHLIYDRKSHTNAICTVSVLVLYKYVCDIQHTVSDVKLRVSVIITI